MLAFTHAGLRGVDARLPTFTLVASTVELLPARGRTLDYAARQPVVEVSWHQASAYAAFVAAQDGLPWRLPHELEWEKAARGVDGRIYTWGDHFEVNWASLSGSRDGPPSLDVIGAFPTDESPYGLRDVVGGVREWSANQWRIDGGVCDGTMCWRTTVTITCGSSRSSGRRGGQRAPAYDLTHSYGPGGEHTLLVAGEGREPGRDALRRVSVDAGLSIGVAERVTSEVLEALSGWRIFAREAGVGRMSTTRVAAAVKAALGRRPPSGRR